MLLPAKIVNAAYAAPLREFLFDGVTVAALIDWSDERRRYFRADTFPLGLVAKRERDHGGTIDVTAAGESFSIAASDLSVDGHRSEWSLAAMRRRRGFCLITQHTINAQNRFCLNINKNDRY